MIGNMIMFDHGNVRFQLRAVGVAINDNKVLIHRAEKDDFWALPGGRIELLESSKITLIREMMEELRTEVEVERLLWAAENFFEYEGKAFHEIGYYYLLKLPDYCPLYSNHEEFYGDEQGTKLIFKWHPLNELKDIVLYPTFLKEKLLGPLQGMEHIISTEP
ncbi:MAG: NUDIX hydrolase [Clostridia bacterium]|nr:NUDIX hydrolase [Clostridia bacterium]